MLGRRRRGPRPLARGRRGRRPARARAACASGEHEGAAPAGERRRHLPARWRSRRRAAVGARPAARCSSTTPSGPALEAGLVQRAELLDAILTDLYGPRRLLRRRAAPARGRLRPRRVRPRRRPASGCPGRGSSSSPRADLVRGADGEWLVLGDRTQAPSGAGYAMENRRVVSRVLPDLYRDSRLAAARAVLPRHAAGAAGGRAGRQPRRPTSSCSPRAPQSETAFDQAFLSSLLGYPLVEGTDLTVRDGRVWLRTARPARAGRRHPAPGRRGVLRPAGAAAGLPARRPRAARGRPARARSRSSTASAAASWRTRACCRSCPRLCRGAARPAAAAAVGADLVVRRPGLAASTCWPTWTTWCIKPIARGLGPRGPVRRRADRRASASRPGRADRGRAARLGRPGARSTPSTAPTVHPTRARAAAAACCARSRSPRAAPTGCCPAG